MLAPDFGTLPVEAGTPLVASGRENGIVFRWLTVQLVRIGPIVLFVVCLLETAAFLGMVAPVGALIGFASVLAARGIFDPWHIVLAAVAGALIGDQIGFANPQRKSISASKLLAAQRILRARPWVVSWTCHRTVDPTQERPS
jgi:hypothetical protein